MYIDYLGHTINGCLKNYMHLQIQTTLIIALLTESQETVFEVLLGLSFSFQVRKLLYCIP